MVGIIIHHEIVSPELLHIQLTPGGNLFAAAQAKGVLDLVATAHIPLAWVLLLNIIQEAEPTSTR